jgi:hypothetical protein
MQSSVGFRSQCPIVVNVSAYLVAYVLNQQHTVFE